MADLIELIIPKVKAQNQVVSQPTFGTITGGNNNTTSANVEVTAENTAVEVGEEFKVQVKVDTAGSEISEYLIIIDFDTDFLQVVDADPTVQGTQIEFLDTNFTLTDPENDNTVAEVGRIRLNAVAPTGQSFTKDDVAVAEITFQSQAVGSGAIIVVDGVSGTQLVRENGAGLQITTNQTAIDISTVVDGGNGDDGGTDDDQQQDGDGGDVDEGNGNENPANPGTNPPQAPLPNTSVDLPLGSYLLLVAGVLSILISLLLKKPRNDEDN